MKDNKKNDEDNGYAKFKKLYPYKESPLEKKIEREVLKHMDTIMIGALSTFERECGRLWGHNMMHSEKTDVQKHFSKIWMNIRQCILDDGNLQKRKIKTFLRNQMRDIKYTQDTQSTRDDYNNSDDVDVDIDEDNKYNK